MMLLAVLVTLIQALPVVRDATRAFGAEAAGSCGCASIAALGTTSTTLGLTVFSIGGALLLGILWRALALFLKTREFPSSFSVGQPSKKLRDVASALGLEGGVLEISGERAGVFCAGFIRPRLYVAARAVQALEREELRAVLEHERYHLERRDPLRMFIAELVLWCLRFVPGIKRMYEEFRTSVELAADEAAIERLGSNRALSSALLRLLSQHGGTRVAAPVGVAYFGVTDRRIEHLLGEHQPRSRRTFVVFALVGFLALAGAGWSGLRVRAMTASAGETAIIQCRQVQHSCQKPKTFFQTWMSTEATLTSAR